MDSHAHEPGTPDAAEHDALTQQRDRLRLHTPRLVKAQHVYQEIHGAGPVGRFNSRVAVIVTRSVGTMWAAYAFALIAFISLPQALNAFLHGDTVTGVNWLAQSFLQLILLPIIIVGQQVISAAQDKRAEADHETLQVLHTINVQQLEILEQQHTMLSLLRTQAAPAAPTIATRPDVAPAQP